MYAYVSEKIFLLLHEISDKMLNENNKLLYSVYKKVQSYKSKGVRKGNYGVRRRYHSYMILNKFVRGNQFINPVDVKQNEKIYYNVTHMFSR